MVDCACDAISGRGIGVGTGFVGPGFDVAPVDCWAPAVFPLRTQQNEINKPIRSTRRIRAKSELFWDSWAASAAVLDPSRTLRNNLLLLMRVQFGGATHLDAAIAGGGQADPRPFTDH
jgi:hypothetical protein